MAEEHKPAATKEEKPVGDDSKTLSDIPSVDPKDDSDISLCKVRSRNFVILTKYIAKQGIDPWVFLHITKETLKRISSGKQNADFSRFGGCKGVSRRSPIAKSGMARRISLPMRIMVSSKEPPSFVTWISSWLNGLKD
jgi:hypothetical protein